MSRKTYQNAENGNVTGVSVGRLDIDRARPDRIEETGVYIEYRPFIFSTTGAVRRGIELFPYTDGVPANLGDISNTVGQNPYNTLTLTGNQGGSYTYPLP